jgi:cytochrome b involved in lipid metabolism
MKKMILAVLIVILAFGIASIIRLNSSITNSASHESINPEVNGVNEQNSEVPIETNTLISKETLAKHNKQSDCWVGYGGKVYDITSFLPNHPGSARAIAPYCGTSEEFTSAFTKQHGKGKVKMLMNVGVLIGDFEIKGNL